LTRYQGREGNKGESTVPAGARRRPSGGGFREPDISPSPMEVCQRRCAIAIEVKSLPAVRHEATQIRREWVDLNFWLSYVPLGDPLRRLVPSWIGRTRGSEIAIAMMKDRSSAGRPSAHRGRPYRTAIRGAGSRPTPGFPRHEGSRGAGSRVRSAHRPLSPAFFDRRRAPATPHRAARRRTGGGHPGSLARGLGVARRNGSAEPTSLGRRGRN
jgi:hypothetical protein